MRHLRMQALYFFYQLTFQNNASFKRALIITYLGGDIRRSRSSENFFCRRN